MPTILPYLWQISTEAIQSCFLQTICTPREELYILSDTKRHNLTGQLKVGEIAIIGAVNYNRLSYVNKESDWRRVREICRFYDVLYFPGPAPCVLRYQQGGTEPVYVGLDGLSRVPANCLSFCPAKNLLYGSSATSPQSGLV